MGINIYIHISNALLLFIHDGSRNVGPVASAGYASVLFSTSVQRFLDVNTFCIHFRIPRIHKCFFVTYKYSSLFWITMSSRSHFITLSLEFKLNHWNSIKRSPKGSLILIFICFYCFVTTFNANKRLILDNILRRFH